MFSIKTGRQRLVGQEFRRELLAEYNPHFTLERYVAYIDLKKIISEIVERQERLDHLRTKAERAVTALTVATQRRESSADMSRAQTNVSVKSDGGEGMLSTDYLSAPSGPSHGSGGSLGGIHTVMFKSTPLLAPIQSPSASRDGTESRGGPSIIASSPQDIMPIPLHLPASTGGGVAAGVQPTHLLVPTIDELGRLEQSIAALHAKFFEGIKTSHQRVKRFLAEKEADVTKQMHMLKALTEKALMRIPDDVLPGVFRRARNIARFRELNTRAFEKILKKFAERCCVQSLELQAKVRAADNIIFKSELCQPTFSAESAMDEIASIFATVHGLSFEAAQLRLMLWIERDLTTQRRIIPVTECYFFKKGLSQRKVGGRYNLQLIPGLSSRLLTKEIAALAQYSVTRTNTSLFSNGELSVRIDQAVRGDDVYAVQSMASGHGASMASSIIELMLTMQTLSLASAARVSAVIPFMAYANNANACAALAEMLMINGCKQVITVDLQREQVEGMFGNVPIYNISAQMEFITYITKRLLVEERDTTNLAVVSPDSDGVARARRFADDLTKNLNQVLFGTGRKGAISSVPTVIRSADAILETIAEGSHASFAHIIEQAIGGSSPLDATAVTADALASLAAAATPRGSIAGTASVPKPATGSSTTETVFIPVCTALKRPCHGTDDIDVIGDVSGRDVFIVDTLLDECVNALTVARQLRVGGASRITVVATHALFSGDALMRVQDDAIDEIIISDTVNQDTALVHPGVAKKLRIISVAPLLAQSILTLHSDSCLSTLLDR